MSFSQSFNILHITDTVGQWMIMKSNYPLLIEHLENHRPKCKMHTQERQLTRFFVFCNWSTKKTEPNRQFFQNRTKKPKPNRTRGFSQNRIELGKPFRTSLAVTFPAKEHRCPLTSTKLYCLMTEAHVCEQLAEGHESGMAGSQTSWLQVQCLNHYTTVTTTYTFILRCQKDSNWPLTMSRRLIYNTSIFHKTCNTYTLPPTKLIIIARPQ